MAFAFAEDSSSTSADRVRRSTAVHLNQKIDQTTEANIERFRNSSREQILRRIGELDREWDVERVLEANASTLALSGLVLGLTVNRKWFFLPGVVLPFLLQHGLQGWCPPLPTAASGCANPGRNRSGKVCAKSHAGAKMTPT